MRMVSPELDAPQVMVAEHQEEFKPVTAAMVTHPEYGVRVDRDYNTLVLAFRPNDEERARLARGEDIYISLLTFGTAMQAVIVCAGAEDVASIYGVAVAR